jgi:hypothetical protein
MRTAEISNTLSTPESVAAIAVLRVAGFIKRSALQKFMGEQLGYAVSDAAFEASMTELGRRIIRVSGIGGGICLA